MSNDRHTASPSWAPPLLVQGEAHLRRAVTVACVSGVGLIAVTVFVATTSGSPVDPAAQRWIPQDPSLTVLFAAAVIRMLATLAPMVATPVIALVLWWRWSRRVAFTFAGSYLTAMFGSVVLKLVVNRPRPEGVVAAAGTDAASFPSTSVVSAVVFWTLLAVVASRPSPARARWRMPTLVASLVVIVTIGPSRLVVGEHWVTDVVAGYLLAGLVLAGVVLREASQSRSAQATAS